MQTIHEFVRKHGIKIRCSRTDRNPHMAESRDMDHWKCSLSRRGGKRMSVIFSKGFGHGGEEPSAEEVLSTLALDATGYLGNPNFESWASEYGIDTDPYDSETKKHKKTFKAVERQTKTLQKFLGTELAEELMYETEGL